MRREATPVLAFVDAAPHLAVRRAEIDADALLVVDRHALTQHRVPPARGQSAVEPRPAFAAIARAIHGGLTVRARARPHVGAVHRKYPCGLRIAWMQRDRKADVADVARHVVTDAFP